MSFEQVTADEHPSGSAPVGGSQRWSSNLANICAFEVELLDEEEAEQAKLSRHENVS